MEKECMVSVIIPVYNSAPYLRECIESVLGQTLQDIEIICIDDGSTDGSSDILRQYEAENRILLVKQLHRGVSAARNAGIEKACGKYLYFMDSDDLIEPETLERLSGRAEQDALDIVHCNGHTWTDSSSFRDTVIEQNTMMYREHQYNGVMSGSGLMEAFYSNNEYWMTAWLYLYKREMVINKGLRFFEGIIHEDNLFAFVSLLLAERCGYLDAVLYRKRIRSDSITTTPVSFDNAYGYFICHLQMKQFLIDNGFAGRLAAAEAIMFKELSESRRVYALLQSKERYRYHELSYDEQILFQTMVVDFAGGEECSNYSGRDIDPCCEKPIVSEAAEEKRNTTGLVKRTGLVGIIRKILHKILPSTRYNVAWSYQHLTAQLQVQQQLLNHILSTNLRVEQSVEALKDEMKDNS